MAVHARMKLSSSTQLCEREDSESQRKLRTILLSLLKRIVSSNMMQESACIVPELTHLAAVLTSEMLSHHVWNNVTSDIVTQRVLFTVHHYGVAKSHSPMNCVPEGLLQRIIHDVQSSGQICTSSHRLKDHRIHSSQ